MEVRCPVVWYYSEYAGLPLISFQERLLIKYQGNSTGNQFHYQNRHLIKITRKHDFTPPRLHVPIRDGLTLYFAEPIPHFFL